MTEKTEKLKEKKITLHSKKTKDPPTRAKLLARVNGGYSGCFDEWNSRSSKKDILRARPCSPLRDKALFGNERFPSPDCLG